jgi:phosphate-selective porin
VGINWYLNANLKLMLDYQNVDIDRLDTVAGSFKQNGQSYNAYGIRTQFSF